jgi:hypothetical protein
MNNHYQDPGDRVTWTLRHSSRRLPHLGLPCSNPELLDYPAAELPWPAGYVRTIEGQNIIVLREGVRNDTQHLPTILVHELLHCGLYEDRERRGQPHSRSLDPREEPAVQAMTDVVLKRLNGMMRRGCSSSSRFLALELALWERPSGEMYEPQSIVGTAPRLRT